MNQVRVLAFGVLKEALGSGATSMTLPDGATVSDLLLEISKKQPSAVLRGIAVSVNAEYATRSQLLRDGDEVGLLPPVSGGATSNANRRGTIPDHLPGDVSLTRDPINAEQLVAAAKQGEDGAIVVFDGIVRNNSRGRKTLHLDYEAYEDMALKQLDRLAHEARDSFGVRQVTIVHRLGRLTVGETSVLIVVASAHRAQAFEACRWLIDTLKRKVPIWKKETFVDGAVWADGEPFPADLAVEARDAS
jgi:molybdopterin synthase catalytic subunit